MRRPGPPGVFTADGATWQQVTDGPRTTGCVDAALGDRLVAMDRESENR